MDADGLRYRRTGPFIQSEVLSLEAGQNQPSRKCVVSPGSLALVPAAVDIDGNPALAAVARTLLLDGLAAGLSDTSVRESAGHPRMRPMKGATPNATVSAQMYVLARSGKSVTTLDGTEGRIVKANRGLLEFTRSRRTRAEAS